MQKVLQDRLTELSAALDLAPERVEALAGLNMYQRLQASECLLVESYEHSIEEKTGVPCDTRGGYIELGPVLHWLNYPDSHWQHIIKNIVKILALIEGQPLPPSKITPELYEKIKHQAETVGVVAQDGSIYGENKYEQLDKGWLQAVGYFLYYQLEQSKVHGFGGTPQVVPLESATNEVRIAIVGDWGTGRFGSDGGPGVAVINAIQSLDPQPDYLIHLGDVYYAGTQSWPGWPGEEQDNFMNLWPADRRRGQARQNTSFTLNSNHEMYDGANGYFKIALGGTDTPFAMQEMTSYFALTFEPWVILGLDSAYHADPKKMFMAGALGDVQTKWAGDNFGQLKGKNVIVMTHHNGISFDGSSQEPFWAEMAEALNGRPDYWYWGHLHNGIVYAETLPSVEGAKVRCVGHGAIPYGKAWGLDGKSGIDYSATTPLNHGGVRVRNGFAVITLGPGETLREKFYEVEDGSYKAIPVWPKA